MTNEKKKDALAPVPDELGILDPKYVEKTLDAISKISAVVKEKLHKGHDYGIIPGTKKPTLLKPGAEKMVKLFGLADTYEVMEQELDWGKPFFFFQIKCTLLSMKNDKVVSEGMGNCNSMEDRFRWRWLYPNELSAEHMDEAGKPLAILKQKKFFSERQKRWYVQYRVENDNIHTLVNTILKMAEKRALIDAVLHATRLSDLFTQDMEDIYQGYVEEVKEETKEVEEKEKPISPKPGPAVKEKVEIDKKPLEKAKPAKEPKEERADTGKELGIDKEGQPVKEEEEEEIKDAVIMASDDQKKAIIGMLGTLTDTYKRPPDEIVKKIHERLVAKFGEARAKIPDDLTFEEANFVIKGLNATIIKEHKKIEEQGRPEEPPVEF
ncbi:MAG: hypothetical protein E3J76_02830 [Candidatus Aminicenantes bacterium]|nr:MAG: hypothetical protein E3J76_02830 [Candidatus Aminicenantes bacterium]